jgi:putative signal transducing protein
MKLVLKTNNPVQLSFAEAVLKDAGIPAEVFDAQMSVMEGSVGVLPRRLMVADADFAEAQRLLREGLPDAVVET